MTLPLIAADLKRFEGCRLTAYWDPIGRCWTIGWGHAGSDVHQGLVWSQATADAQLLADIHRAVEGLDADPVTHGWWRTLGDVRQDALVEIAFNMGERTLDEFKAMLAALRAGEWAAASADALASRWEQQVNGDGRASFVAYMLANDARPT